MHPKFDGFNSEKAHMSQRPLKLQKRLCSMRLTVFVGSAQTLCITALGLVMLSKVLEPQARA